MAPDGDGLIAAQLAVAARYLFRDEYPMRWYVAGRLGVGSAAYQPLDATLRDLRPLAGGGIGFERRVRAIALHADLGAALMAPRFSTAESFGGFGDTFALLRAASVVALGSFTIGAGYYF
jgi:hypothetical protein